MTEPQPYAIALDNRFGYLERIDVPALVEANTERWYNQTLTQVDGSVVRLGIVEGEFHWHHHDDEDELFFVLDGELEIDVEGRDTVVLAPHQGYNIPAGVEHRTRARTKTVMLMMSAAGASPNPTEEVPGSLGPCQGETGSVTPAGTAPRSGSSSAPTTSSSRSPTTCSTTAT